ncbi:hypothetical protein SARC_01425 [Sphaeroforma arctica JP610]|uniref:Uncharacterized protein n=1 Tax=Sphaeroforma arctica JP610 TaxID=667725 RepID=A0A0L0GBY4_9EUKA|nr:hypothetical protein SARC_01425 [Sphaeroforma arctica JP610]KNC86419.1 hypothetical protein SARC_01425 [Sphaeroforma arctica JP610]|eukprot:XP_014160321.1 hypothetical protein SARC_01425 [Sphaeroforma arctica JP610]
MQPIWFVLIIEYERMWLIAITMCELLLTLSILALLNVQPQDKLHPKNTQNITFQKALKSVKDASQDQFAEMVTADRIEIIIARNDAEPDKKLQSSDRLSPANISMRSPLSGEHAEGYVSRTYNGSLGNALNENIISL